MTRSIFTVMAETQARLGRQVFICALIRLTLVCYAPTLCMQAKQTPSTNNYRTCSPL